mgnify:CR=1 FL=1
MTGASPGDRSPAVSVIIPCFNLGRYLEEAVVSVRRQTFHDFEIIVVDDGSTDPETSAVLDRCVGNEATVLREPHRGLAAARNTAIASARGRYLCALDADDRLLPTFLEKTVAVLERDPAVTFVSAWLRTFGDESWEWTPERCDLPTLLSENTVLTAAVVRAEAVEAVGRFNTGMPVQGDEDWDLWLSLVERGYRGVILPEILFEYRRRPGQMSTDCWWGPGHLPLAEYRIARHASSYREHLVDVLLRQDRDLSALLRANDARERYLATELEPFVEARRAQLTALQRLAAASPIDEAATDRDGSGDQTAAAQALAAAHAEIKALRASRSWQVTAPLRRAYEVWLRLRNLT